MLMKTHNVFFKSIENILSYFTSFLIIIMTGGIWTCDPHININLWEQYEYLITILIFGDIILFLISSPQHITNTVKRNIILAIIIIFSFSIINKTGQSSFNYFILTFLWLLFFVMQLSDKKIMWKTFTNIVLILSVISLFFYLFGTILNLIPEANSIQRQWGTWDPNPIKNYYYMYYESQVTYHKHFELWRNCGIFAEAPMYNIVLCTAISAELFINNRIIGKKICLTILLITLVSTFSATGFIFLIAVFIMYLINNKNKYPLLVKYKKVFWGVLILSFLAFIIVGITKVQTPQGAGSLAVRSDHIISCLKVWKHNFVFGAGWLNYDSIKNIAHFKQGLSVGLPYFFACGGLLLGSIIIVFYFKVMINATKTHNYNFLIFCTSFLIVFLFTAVIHYPILILYIVYSVTNIENDIKTDK